MGHWGHLGIAFASARTATAEGPRLKGFAKPDNYNDAASNTWELIR